MRLPDKRFGRENEDRLVAGQHHQLGGHRKLDGFAKANLVGQDEAGAARISHVGFKGKFDEKLLVFPKADVLSVNRGFNEDRGGLRGFAIVFAFVVPFFDAGDNHALAEAVYVFDDELGERNGGVVAPEGVKFFLDPFDGIR